MLITERFFKDIKGLDKYKRNLIINKLSYFEKEIIQNEGKIRKSSPGFWIIGLKNGIYKFRLNIKDRILFTLKENRETGKRTIVQFLRYVSHDEQIRVAESIEINKSFIELKDNYIEDEKEEIILKEYEDIITNEIVSILVEEESLKDLLENGNEEDFLYYLSDEQYEIIKSDNKRPIIVNGAGGTGKTIVLLNKLLGIELLERKKLLYITYTELLSDKVKKMYEKFSKSENIYNKVEFYSLNKFYEKICLIDSNKIITSYEAIKWIESKKYAYPILKKIKGYEIYSEIKGIIKGYLGLDGINISKLKKDYKIKLEDYLNIPSKYSIFSIEEKKEIYRFASNYQKWLDEIDKYDENNLSIEVIEKFKRNIEKYDYIVVDEIQDFTEVQIYMIQEILKDKNNIIWAGDVHQTVNPTFFEFSRLKNIYYSDKNTQMDEFTLSKNYRSTKQIINITNKISDYRKKTIGVKDDYNENSLKEGVRPGIIIPNEKNLLEILKSISNKVYCAIIVSDNDDKNKLINIYPKAKGRIFTVYEIKGLEYDNIYCYNIISKHKENWVKIFNEDVKHNTKMRYYFNLLYVAISRAKEFVCLYEDNVDMIPSDFISDFNLIKEISNNNIYTLHESSELEIEKEIEQLDKSGNFEQANSLRLHKKLCINDIKYLKEYLKDEYNTMIYDENEFIKKCIFDNTIEVLDILGDNIVINYNKNICKKCIYKSNCILKDYKTLININYLKENNDLKAKSIISSINDKLYIFEKEDVPSAEACWYIAELYRNFDLYGKSIEFHTKAIEIDDKYINSYYCRKSVYDIIGEFEKSKKDEEKYMELM